VLLIAASTVKPDRQPADPSTEPFVTRSVCEGIATVTMNRGERMNPLSSDMLAALQREIDAIAADESVRVVVLAGAGKHFSAGHDLREMRAHPDEAWQAELFARCSRVMTALVDLPQPVIARVQGAAVVAGCQLVSMCDLAVASEAAMFGLPGVKSGIFCTTPGVGVVRNVSRKRAFELLITGDLIDAATALAWGLVNRVVPADRLDEEVEALARKIAALSPAVTRMGKKLFYEQVEMGLDEAYALAGAGMARNMMLDDAAEGIDAFLAKRAPKWRGK
jgi:enoyl-CoA hydratase/carnithine racemase